MVRITPFSLYCAFRHFLHTLLMLVILAATVALIWFGMVTNVVLIFIFAPGAASLLYTFPMEHVMKKYMPKEEKKYTEDGEEIVAWYNE